MKNKIFTIIITIIITVSANAQKPILFIGGTAHIGNGEVINNSAISILNGRFELVADASLIRIDPSLELDSLIEFRTELSSKKIYTRK